MIAITVLLLSLIIQNSSALTANSTASDKALDLITNVLPLDNTKYTASLAMYNKPSSGLADNVNEEYVTYNLVNNGEVTTVSCAFKNGRLFTLMATAPPTVGLFYTSPSSDLLDLAKGTMERYQTFLADRSLSEMIAVLGEVKSITNATINSGNIKLEVTTDSYGTIFYWKHVYNGVDYDEVSIVFQQTRRLLIGDRQSRYKMGSTEIKIPEEQALETAIKYVENYSYEAIKGTGEDETRITVRDFNISRERTTVELTNAERDGLLYPYWNVKVALGDLYPGNVYGFSVGIWADSGEVAQLGTLAVGYDPNSYSPIDDTTNNSSSQEDEDVDEYSNGVAIAAVASAVLIVAAVTLFAIKRRSK